MQEVIQKFLFNLQQTSFLEYVAVFTGIASVWFSKKENILVYPVGLVNTIIYVCLSVREELYGEASVNLYYTVVSIYGWVIWAKKDQDSRPVLHVTTSTGKEWMHHLLFFAAFYIAIYFALSYLKT